MCTSNHACGKILSVISVLFIIIGVLSSFHERFRFNIEYKALSIAFIGVGATIFIGHMSGAATPDRIFHLVTFTLAPFCIIGGIKFLESLIKISKVFKSKNRIKKDKTAIVAISLFLVVYFLSNTGFFSEVVFKDFPGAPIYLSAGRIENNGSLLEKEYLHRTYVLRCDVLGGEWLSRTHDTTMKIYADHKGYGILTQSVYKVEINYKEVEVLKIEKIEKLKVEPSYIYLRKLNSKDGIFIVSNFPRLNFFNLSEISSLLYEKNKIYENTCSEIYEG
ncbi:MAG: DUF2206 domain-containing protein [Archaeoglobaceae archaeon]